MDTTPPLIAVTKPALVTDATVGSLLAQVPPGVEFVNVSVLPMQIVVLPDDVITGSAGAPEDPPGIVAPPVPLPGGRVCALLAWLANKISAPRNIPVTANRAGLIQGDAFSNHL